jgi:2,4-dienoyl-CoA reductase-like NADH-dependent reductase (Old Yellow Enzyme family)
MPYSLSTPHVSSGRVPPPSILVRNCMVRSCHIHEACPKNKRLLVMYRSHGMVARRAMMTTLFNPLKLGDLKLPNRIIMAPLTRSRAGDSRTPNHLMAEYYAQRASAGLIVSEATVVSPMGIGYADTPGIWSQEQVEGWKLTTRAVHEAGGRMFLQLWHVGRVSDPSFLNGALPLAPSAVAAQGNVSLLRPPTPFVTPRALVAAEIPGIIDAFRSGALNAQLAGFDGVELHGANGYLLDQFLQDGSNLRTDDYGGPIENRARLMLEVADAAISVWGAGRVGVHLAPRGDAHSMGDSDLTGTFEYVARRLGERKIAFLCAREHLGADRLGPKLKAAFGGPYIANEKFTYETAQQALASGDADAVAFGKLFIANPDLPLRFALHAPLNEWRPAEFYAGGARGYTDYPSLAATDQSPDLNVSHARVNARASSGL